MPKVNYSRSRRVAGRIPPTTPPSRPARPERPVPTQHLGARRPNRYKLDGRLVAFEHEIGEFGKDLRHRAQQASRLVYRKRKPVKKGKGYKVRVAGRGVVYVGRAAAGAAAAAVAGAYLSTRWSARHAKRAVKFTAPHVKKATVHTARRAQAYGSVYGGAAYQKAEAIARKARRKAVRARARNRIKIAKTRTWAAGRLDRAHTDAFQKGHERKARTLLASAVLVAPKRRGSMLASLKSTPQQTRAARAENSAIHQAQQIFAAADRERRRPQNNADRKARGKRLPRTPTGQPRRDGRVGSRGLPPRSTVIPPLNHSGSAVEPARPVIRTTTQQPLFARKASTARPGRPAVSAGPAKPSRGGIVMTQRNPAAALEKIFNEIGDYQPEDYQDWLHFVLGLAKAFRAGAEGVTVLAARMDIIEQMDVRALQDFYLGAEGCGALMQMFGSSARKFWVLYADRVEPNSGRGRTMKDENKFFKG